MTSLPGIGWPWREGRRTHVPNRCNLKNVGPAGLTALIGSCFSRPAVPLLDEAEIQGLRHDDGGFLLIDDLTKRWERAEARRQGVNPGDQKLTLQAAGLDAAVELGCRLMQLRR